MLTRAQIIEAAAVLMESLGERPFSLRKLADALGCDPMTILYHCKSKDGLLRALSDQLVARLGTTAAGFALARPAAPHCL